MSVPSFIQMGLAIIFGLTGILKLYSPSSMKSTLIAIGIPKPLSSAGAWLVPLFEVLTAVFLLSRATVWIGEILAFGLIGGFIYAIFIALYKKEQIKCNCFGKLRDEYLGWGTILRVLMLLIMNSYITIANHPASFAAIHGEDLVLYILSWVGILGLYMIAQFIISAISNPQTD
ncbi:MauE/DoxX family redox-associated membrane protein [Paenibacillus gorillae]|uniref:MauE/DoxX family redox-associated membrane protein n=1 Tax=Paenibacillus gorillae TaxID=1243662 RepID=UPI0004B25BDF|nr:MauE/DoxX family redox-associated membrane protein [Paenibacillus gorillae]